MCLIALERILKNLIMDKSQGFSIIQLIVVLAIVGILVGIAASSFPRGDIELKQAARSFAISVQKARSEAIRKNKFVGIIVPTNNSFSIFVDENSNTNYDSATDTIVSLINFAIDYPSVSITKSSSNKIIFNPRGFARVGIAQTIKFSSFRSSSTVNVDIGSQGETKVN